MPLSHKFNDYFKLYLSMFKEIGNYDDNDNDNNYGSYMKE
jgi:hypothetical protein